MRILSLFMATIVAFAASALSAEPDTRVFEMRTYFAPEGKLDALHARFRDHTIALFEKHGMTNLGYWVPIENPDRKLIYVLAYPSREARQKAWAAFGADPEWKAAKTASEANGTLVSKVEELYLQATDYSPAITPAVGKGERIFELRTYTTSPGKLSALDARFRDHTVSLFAKHGMTNLFYWRAAAGQPRAENTLIYFLAHDSVEAAKKSFEAFRADPDWISARKASEEKAGGSLTVPDGVQSLFLKATDYSRTR
ncbi:MAG TPA: NIPSNAP family protein [Chthoniobacteraceae bacterium]|jgi:hypothetical protein